MIDPQILIYQMITGDLEPADALTQVALTLIEAQEATDAGPN